MSSGKEPEDPQRLFALSVEWIDVQDDPLRQNRLVASLSYTLPIKTAGGAGVPLTLVYADRSEFLGDPDHQLSAHVGISFDINRKK